MARFGFLIFFRHILHMRCWRLRRGATVKFIVWISLSSACLIMFGCGFRTCSCILGFLLMRCLLHVLTSSLYFPLLPLNSLSFRYKTFFVKRIRLQIVRDSRAERMSVGEITEQFKRK